MTDHDLHLLLDQSRRNNEAASITGMLVYSEGSFLQVLEGPAEAVAETFDRISKDVRHQGILRLMHGPIETRSFKEWSMGFLKTTQSELMQIPGCNDFFAGGACLHDVDAGSAKTILRQFLATNSR